MGYCWVIRSFTLLVHIGVIIESLICGGMVRGCRDPTWGESGADRQWSIKISPSHPFVMMFQ
jgi:hypothetical protein